jgi:hypothetical protein
LNFKIISKNTIGESYYRIIKYNDNLLQQSFFKYYFCTKLKITLKPYKLCH